MKVLVGSTALAHYLPDIKPKDLDYFSDQKIEGAENFYHPNLEKYKWSGEVASLDELYTIKVSHAFWEMKNSSWQKHMIHVIKMQQAGAKFIPALHDILYPIWVERYGAKRANLEADPEDFFAKTVTRLYEHDSIHASIAYHDNPLFEKILRDDHAVAVSKQKFEALTHQEKIELVHEEIFATALERKVIPGEMSWSPAYQWSLRKLITSFSKGWFPLWVVLHFDELKLPPFNFYEKMKQNQHKLIPLSE